MSPVDFILLPAKDLCLRFANTLYWRGEGKPTETLGGLRDVVEWCVAEGLVPEERVERLQKYWLDRNAAAIATSFREAIAFREAVYRIFESVVLDRRPSSDDSLLLNDYLAGAPARLGVEQRAGRFGWRVAPARAHATAALLAPVAWSAADLLVGEESNRIRRCENESCLWLFIDESKAGTRRWCSMSSCGNRAKAQRHYLRHKSIRPGA
jgi:predicted RNA-binding Zn ribbon-like protein